MGNVACPSSDVARGSAHVLPPSLAPTDMNSLLAAGPVEECVVVLNQRPVCQQRHPGVPTHQFPRVSLRVAHVGRGAFAPGQPAVVRADDIDPVSPRARFIEVLERFQRAQHVSVGEGHHHLCRAVRHRESAHVPRGRPGLARVLAACQHIADRDHTLIGGGVRVVGERERSLGRGPVEADHRNEHGARGELGRTCRPVVPARTIREDRFQGTPQILPRPPIAARTQELWIAIRAVAGGPATKRKQDVTRGQTSHARLAQIAHRVPGRRFVDQEGVVDPQSHHGAPNEARIRRSYQAGTGTSLRHPAELGTVPGSQHTPRSLKSPPAPSFSARTRFSCHSGNHGRSWAKISAYL